MNILFRLLLLMISMGALFFVLKKIRNSQMQIDSAVFWIMFMLGLIVVSIFPGIIIWFSNLIGVESPANFVFLSIIFLMLLKVFNQSLQISKLQYQIEQLTQVIALKELESAKKSN